MNDTFLPGSGFDTYESQDKVLMQMDGSTEAAVAVRILQQQGFAVVGAVVRLAPEQAEAAQRAKKAAEALGIECILLNAEALAQQPEAAGAWPQFAALLTAADKLGIQYIGSSSRARLEVGTDGVHTVLPPVDAARDDSTALAALPQETLARLLLPLGGVLVVLAVGKHHGNAEDQTAAQREQDPRRSLDRRSCFPAAAHDQKVHNAHVQPDQHPGCTHASQKCHAENFKIPFHCPCPPQVPRDPADRRHWLQSK